MAICDVSPSAPWWNGTPARAFLVDPLLEPSVKPESDEDEPWPAALEMKENALGKRRDDDPHAGWHLQRHIASSHGGTTGARARAPVRRSTAGRHHRRTQSVQVQPARRGSGFYPCRVHKLWLPCSARPIRCCRSDVWKYRGPPRWHRAAKWHSRGRRPLRLGSRQSWRQR